MHFTKTPAQRLRSNKFRPGGDMSIAPGVRVNGIAKGVGRRRLFVLSAQDQNGLLRQKKVLSLHLERLLDGEETVTNTEEYLRDLSFTLGKKRSRLPWNTVAVASSLCELQARFADEESSSICRRSIHTPKVCFAFTGQGAQWAQMGIDLCRHYPVFRESIEEADDYLRLSLGCTWSTVEEICRDEAQSNINNPAYSQPICTVLQVALVDLLESWNITPSVIVGHSSGEIAGAYCLGALSREDAWKTAYYRGVVSSQIRTRFPTLQGAMLAVGASEDHVEGFISRLTRGEVVVACVNSPKSVTISGDLCGIEDVEAMLKQEHIFARRLRVDNAYHSPHMDKIATAYVDAIRDVQPMLARLGPKMYSAVTGDIVDPLDLGPIAWMRNLVSPVRFSDAVQELLRPEKSKDAAPKSNVDIFVEIGPHSALQGPLNEIANHLGLGKVDYLSVLSRGRKGVDTAMTVAGMLFAHGVAVNLDKVNSGLELGPGSAPRLLVNVPSYAWNHSQTFWAESRLEKQYQHRSQVQTGLLGAACPTMGENERLWRGFLRASKMAWVRDHEIEGSILFPAAGYIAMAIEAAQTLVEQGSAVRGFRCRDVQITAAVVVPEDSAVEHIVQLRPHLTATRDNSSSWFEFTVSTSVDGNELRKNCSGLVVAEYEAADNSTMALERALEDQAAKDEYDEIQEQCQSVKDSRIFYNELASLGLNYGPAFQNMENVRTCDGKSCCTVKAFPWGTNRSEAQPPVTHPATLDAMLHAAFAAFKGGKGQLKEAMVPRVVDEIFLSVQSYSKNDLRFKGFATATKHGFRELMADIDMLDAVTMKPAVTIRGLCFVSIPGAREPQNASGSEKSMCTKLTWIPALRQQHGNKISMKTSSHAAYDETFILEPSNPSLKTKTLSSLLASELRALGTIPKSMQWRGDTGRLKPKSVISLVEVDDPLLMNMDAEQFGMLQKLVLNTANLLWVSTDNPAGSLAPGMARSVRNENPATQLRTLMLSCKSLECPESLAPPIASLATTDTADHEFCEENFVLSVPRVVQDEVMNNRISDLLYDCRETIEYKTLEQVKDVCKLAIQNQGMLDSLCFKVDEHRETPLAEDEVEIAVKASGLKYVQGHTCLSLSQADPRQFPRRDGRNGPYTG